MTEKLELEQTTESDRQKIINVVNQSMFYLQSSSKSIKDIINETNIKVFGLISNYLEPIKEGIKKDIALILNKK